MFAHVPISDDEKLWRATLERWKLDAEELGDEGVFLALDVDQRLNGLKQRTETEKDLHCYFLVKTGNEYASSILEVSHAHPKSDKPWLKLLSITLRPSLLPVPNMSTEKMKEVFLTLAYSITHSLDLIFKEHISKELKIYGRTPEMVNLFRGIISSDMLDTILDTFQLTIKLEGNWLVVAKVEA